MSCLFCKIKNNELPIKKIAENKHAIAFLDAFPASHGHCLVIPKEHYDNLTKCSLESYQAVMSLVQEVAQKLEHLDIGIQGFNYLSNQNEIAGQVIPHFHMHIIPKYTKDSGINVTNNKIKEDSDIEKKINYLIIK